VTELRVVPLEALRDRVSMAAAVAAVERGFRTLAHDEADLPEPMVAGLRGRDAEIHVKGALLRGDRYFVLKVATGFYRNRERGLPSGDGMFLLLDAETGRPSWLLLERGYLTDLRTAAAIALTLKYLAPRGVTEALLIGAGAVGCLAARAIIAELPITRLTIWNRTPERAEALARELGGVVDVRVAGALDPEVRGHRIIVSATASTAPLVQSAAVHVGTHVTSAGTGSAGKVELDPALLARADKLVVDRVTQTERYGNLRYAVAAGAMTRDRVYAELGDLAAGRRPGRERDDEITVADLTGVGVQDAAIAQAVVAAIEGGTT
jgi:ornithine cyclodeaminase